MIYTQDQIRQMIAPIAEKYHLKAVFLCGSYARGDATESSDVDLLVDTTGTSLKSLLSLGARCTVTWKLLWESQLIWLQSALWNRRLKCPVRRSSGRPSFERG